jgi:uncharacterized protein YndB with AHSA1/START domain
MGDGEQGRRQLVLSAGSAAPVETLWAWLASPAHWPQWAPHIRRVAALGAAGGATPGSLQPGQRLRIHPPGLLGLPPGMKARVTTVEPPRRWSFTVSLAGLAEMDATHWVEPEADGCRVWTGLTLRGPGSLVAPALLPAYAPLARHALHRLAALAERSAQPAGSRRVAEVG